MSNSGSSAGAKSGVKWSLDQSSRSELETKPGSRGGTVASTYGLCHHVHMCPNLPHQYNAPGKGQRAGDDVRVCQSCAELVGIP